MHIAHVILLRRLLLLSFSFAASVLAPASDADASVSFALSIDELARASTSVARIVPLGAESTWEDGRIVTLTRVRVEDPIGGRAAAGEVLRVRTLGGIVENVGQSVEGEPRFVVGAPSIVFLSERAGRAHVTGRAQGQLAIVRTAEGREVVRSTPPGALVAGRTPLAGPLPSTLAGRGIDEARAAVSAAFRRRHAH